MDWVELVNSLKLHDYFVVADEVREVFFLQGFAFVVYDKRGFALKRDV